MFLLKNHAKHGYTESLNHLKERRKDKKNKWQEIARNWKILEDI